MSIQEIITICFAILTIIFSISAILDSYKAEKIINKMIHDIKKREPK